jgi:hypothetical protein
MVGSVGQPNVFHNNNPNFSSGSSFEYNPPGMMMMPGFQQQQQQQQMMYQPVQMQSSIPQNYMYPTPQHGMPFGYHPMMQQARMIPRGMPMPMMAGGNTFAAQPNSFQNPATFFNPMLQQLVY